MTQEEFTKLSENQVKQLNGEQENENVTLAWRDGYIYFQRLVRKYTNEMYNEEFVSKMIELGDEDLDTFN